MGPGTCFISLNKLTPHFINKKNTAEPILSPEVSAACIFVGRISRTFDAKYLADWQSRLQQEQLCGFLVASCR